MKLLATTKSQILASAHYVSNVWIKNDPALHDIDQQFTITVKDRAQFQSFRVIPKVCDWMFNCQDVIIVTQADTDHELSLIERRISFKFNPIVDSEYIKLHFYVEYFKPSCLSLEESHTISFDLKLVHFGDPCFQESKCLANQGQCLSDRTTSKPNDLVCKCDSTRTGKLCEKKDRCEYYEVLFNRKKSFLLKF